MRGFMRDVRRSRRVYGRGGMVAISQCYFRRESEGQIMRDKNK